MKATRMKVYGVGVNDADYVVNPTINGRHSMCHFYSTWKGMIARCYSHNQKSKYPSYSGCSVCDKWLTFSNFKAWMEKQDWEGKEIDKDLLAQGNKVYSPVTCVFVDKLTNSFTLNRSAARGEYPLGVTIHKQTGNLMAQCKNPFTKKTDYLGLFTCPNQAHEAWRKRKHELACQLADLQSDERVAVALRTRYANPL